MQNKVAVTCSRKSISIFSNCLPKATCSLLALFVQVVQVPTASPAEVEDKPRLYRIAQGKDEPVCLEMMKLYNADIARFGVEQFIGEPFSAIKCSRFLLEGQSAAQICEIDLYNAGTNEKLVKIKNSGMGPLESREFPEYLLYSAPEEEKGSSASPISMRDFYGKSRTIRPRSYRFLHKGKVEMLNLYPEIAVPFVFNGVTYVSVGDLDRASLRTGEQMISSGFLVIARYLGNIEAYEGAFKAKARAKKLTPAKTLTEKEMLQIQEEFFKTVCVLVR